MGYALARAGAARGHAVVLVSGPVSLQPPPGVRLLSVTTAAEMLERVDGELGACDALVMAAAVADWRPADVSDHKLKKDAMAGTIQLERTPDILARIVERKGNRLYVGFAAETRDLVAEAKRKLEDKRLDMIVANDVSREDSGFESDTNRVTLITAGGAVDELPLLSKDEVADRIVQWLEERAGRADGTT